MSEIEKKTSAWISIKQVSEISGFAVSTINGWIADKDHPFPKGKKFGASHSSPRRWKREVIEQYITDDAA